MPFGNGASTLGRPLLIEGPDRGPCCARDCSIEDNDRRLLSPEGEAACGLLRGVTHPCWTRVAVDRSWVTCARSLLATRLLQRRLVLVGVPRRGDLVVESGGRNLRQGQQNRPAHMIADGRTSCASSICSRWRRARVFRRRESERRRRQVMIFSLSAARAGRTRRSGQSPDAALSYSRPGRSCAMCCELHTPNTGAKRPTTPRPVQAA